MARVNKIMNSQVLTLAKEAKISDAVKLMSNKMQGCVVVVDGKKPIGIVTEADIIRNLVSKKGLKKRMSELMSSPITIVNENTKLEKVSKIIDTKHFRRYPVVDQNGNLVGIVTENDVVHTINDDIRFHRNLQNAVLIIFVIFEFFVFVLYEFFVDYFGFLR